MKKRYNVADHRLLPLPPHDITIVVNTVPIRGGGVVDHDPVLHLPVIATVTVTIAMPENIPKNQNEKVRVKNGVDHLAKNGRANIKAAAEAEVMTAEKKRRKKRSRNEVIIIARQNHHLPTAAAVMMMIQT